MMLWWAADIKQPSEMKSKLKDLEFVLICLYD